MSDSTKLFLKIMLQRCEGSLILPIADSVIVEDLLFDESPAHAEPMESQVTLILKANGWRHILATMEALT